MDRKCSKCGAKMKLGHLHSGFWIEKKPIFGPAFFKMSMWPITREMKTVNSYLCEKCGVVELRVDLEKNK